MQSALHYSHSLLDQLIARFPDGYFIDATLGKGHDITYILSRPHFTGCCLGFDIQAQALAYSQDRLDQAGPFSGEYRLIQDSHANLGHYLEEDRKVHGAIFNLGYLPGGDHQITTHVESTYPALQTLSRQLVQGGQVIVVVYPGHPQGQKESDQLLKRLADWPQNRFQVLTYRFINQINQPPYLLVIERI